MFYLTINTHKAKLSTHAETDTLISVTASAEWQRQANTQDRGEFVNER
jgi:hypothetical protein